MRFIEYLKAIKDKPTCARKQTKNSWSLRSQSGRWKGRRTMEERICG